MPNLTTFELLDSEIQKIGGKPTVLEALWDGDTDGWFLCLFVYVKSGFILKKTVRHNIGHITLGNDLRLFNGEDLTEADLAKEFGRKAIEKYNLVFYFPSDKGPDNDCPSWTDRHLAINCADCDKLIIPTDSPYLPKDICYSCHLERESNARIRSEGSYDEGVNMFLSKNGEYENVGYCTHFKDFPIASFIIDIVERELGTSAINVVKLEKDEIVTLKNKLEKELQFQLLSYEKPVIRESMKRLMLPDKLTYNGVEYELLDRGNNNHRSIGGLISSIQTAERAISEDLTYAFYFKKGIIHRDDSVLRFVNYVCGGSATKRKIQEHYCKILTETEVLNTIKKLEQIGCLSVSEEDVRITVTGRNII